MNPSDRKPTDPEGERPRRNIGSGTGRAAASARLQAVRIALSHELIRAGRVLSRRGMIVATEGNLSARLTPDRMVITRRGRRKGELTTRDFVELEVGEAGNSPARQAASTEHRMHMAAYAARRDVEALLHAHPVALTAFAVRGTAPDFSRFDEARVFLGPIGLVPHYPSGSEALAEAVGQALVTRERPNVLILESHGALAVGTGVDEALARLEIAEHLAAALLAAEGRR
jgi:L-fuculose-phosphate aldolase